MKLNILNHAATAVMAILAISFISGCVSINPGDITNVEHMQVTTVHNATDHIDLDVSTINGYVEIQGSTNDTVEVVYDVFASKGHLYDILTGTNGSRDGNTTKIVAEAKLSNPNNNTLYNRGANIIVKVPKNAAYNLTLTTLNGAIIVPALDSNNVRLTTNNGDINLTLANSSYVKASSLNGGVHAKLQDGTLFSVDASTMNGHVSHGQIHMTSEKETSTQLIGHTEAGNGTLRMDLSTLNGDVTISY